MIEAKRSRFKNPKGRITHPQKNRDEDVSKPIEAREDHPMPGSDSRGPKTSEFAYFKRLKQGDGRTSRINSVNRGSTRTRNFGPAKNARGPAKSLKDVRAPLLAKNSSTFDVGSFFSPQDVAIRGSGMHRMVDDDIEMIESPRVIRTPTTIDIDNILSMSTTASFNPGTQPKEVDIFSSKRRKLQQRILKTLSLEVDKLPKEFDVVSLLMTRLIPESSSTTPSESKNYSEPQAQDKCHDQLRDSSIELNERWDGTKKLAQTSADNFLGGGIYPCQMDEDVSTYSSTYADNLLLGFKEGIEQGSSLNEIDPAQKFGKFDDRNLLTWDNDHCDYSSKYKTGGSIFKNEVHDPFSNIFNGEKSCKFRANGDSYELPLQCYDQCSDNHSRYCLEYKDERLDSKYDMWHPISSARFGSSALDNLRNSPDTDEFPDNCCRRSLIEYTNERTDCKLDSMEPNNWHPIRFGSSALDNLRHSPDMDEFADNCCRRSLIEYTNERTDWHPILFERFESSSVDNFRKSAELNEFELRSENGSLLLPWSTDNTNMDYEDMVGRSNCGPLSLLYGSDPLRPHDTGVFKDVFRGIRFYASSNDQHHHYIGSMDGESLDRVIPAAGALLIPEGFDSDISTDDVCRRMPHPEEEWSMNRIKWLDTLVETSYDHLQTTVDNL